MKKLLILIALFFTTYSICQQRIYFKNNTFKEVKEVKVLKGKTYYENKKGKIVSLKRKDYDFFIETTIGKHIDSSYFKIEDSKLVWQKVFYKEKKDLMSYFIKQVISSLSKDNFQQVENRISFEIKSDKVDYKKYGGKWGNTLSHLKAPLFYLVVIDFKENRYRVTINSIRSNLGGKLGFLEMDNVASKKGVLTKQKIVVRGLKYLNIHFVKTFLLKDKLNEDW